MYKPKPTIEQPYLNTNLPSLILPEIQSLRVALYLQHRRKCQGRMAPERLNILHTALHTAKLKGLHDNRTPKLCI